MMVAGDRAADRRRRRLHDLQRCRQECELVAAPCPRALERDDDFRRRRATRGLADFMDARLHPVQRRIAAAGLDQRVMGAVFDQAAALEGNDAIGRRTVDSRCAMIRTVRPLAISLHILLDDALALIVERAGRLVENQDARVGDSARAIAIRWRWPPESVEPRSPTMVS